MMLDLLFYVFTFLLTLLVGAVTALVIYARWHYGTLEKTKGVPYVIPPYFIGGSDPFFYKTVCSDEDTKRVRKYGKIFGMYEGRGPQIFIADVDIIKSIYIKDFDHFTNQRIVELGHELLNEMMAVLPYEKWKVVRKHLSPQLSTGKIKMMTHQMMDAINDFVVTLENKIGDGDGLIFYPKYSFGQMTVDVLSRCVFGTKVNSVKDEESVFVQNIKKLTWGDGDADIMFSLVLTFPFIAAYDSFIAKDVLDYFATLLRDILKTRREEYRAAGRTRPEKINDFVDVLNEMIVKCDEDPEYKALGIREPTVLSQAMIFFIAGLDTTSTSVALMAYHLANHPEIQRKVTEELDAYLERHGGKVEHATVYELEYLNAVLNESLRMHPPSMRTERVCNKDWKDEKSGLEIKKGMLVQVPILAIHFDPEYYEDPEEFKPERWLPENKHKLNPYAFLAFGLGPHDCFGRRFGKDEVMLTMASVIKKFGFVALPGEELNKTKGRLIINSYSPFKVKLVKRT